MFDTLIKFRKDRDKLDFYATDSRAVEEILKVEKFSKVVLEPSCGQGHVGRVLEKKGYIVKASDIVYRGYGEEKDFFAFRNNNLDILTNPPYYCGEEFLEHALNISEVGVKIGMLFRLAFLEGQSRRKLFDMNPPKRVYVFSKRISCAKNGDFEKYKTAGFAFAWFIFCKGYKGKTTLKWI